MSVEVNLIEVADYFYRANQMLQKDRRYLMNEVALIAKEDVKNRIKAGKVDPNGSAWSAWKPKTKEIREKKGNVSQGLLFDTGSLLNSITSKSNTQEAEIFTRKSYAQYLEDGTRHMSARSFMSFSKDLDKRVERAFYDFIDRAVEK